MNTINNRYENSLHTAIKNGEYPKRISGYPDFRNRNTVKAEQIYEKFNFSPVGTMVTSIRP